MSRLRLLAVVRPKGLVGFALQFRGSRSPWQVDARESQSIPFLVIRRRSAYGKAHPLYRRDRLALPHPRQRRGVARP
jgi:hypothetical protein